MDRQWADQPVRRQSRTAATAQWLPGSDGRTAPAASAGRRPRSGYV
ncbi:MAG: hypothetical protein NZ959_12395 [Armatimonadetes bacterium]|nr:hypothetical protein [Armatimonadota bacterium]MDW8122692.1 hypothetical protein [Armatimonadota bacterium]